MSKADAVEAIKDWFLSNFEDPVHHTPYESAEGGYQYIWGGPYEARDIIENVFEGRAQRSVIEEAIGQLEGESLEWVPSSSRQQPPEPDFENEDEPPSRSSTELYREMQGRIRELEEVLAHTPRPPSGIGHNRPPESLDLEPLDESDRKEINEALDVIKSQPVEPADAEPVALAYMKFETKLAKLGKWLAKQGEVFTTEAVKEAGKQTGKWAPRAFWLWLMDRMFGVSEAIGAWLHIVKDSIF
jgi:hypothetical protein